LCRFKTEPGVLLALPDFWAGANKVITMEMLGKILTLPLKNVSLAEWFNSDKENGNDENIKGALHARIQARGG